MHIFHSQHILSKNRESVAGSVIQATGTGLWIGNHLKARNSLQRVCTIPRCVHTQCVHTQCVHTQVPPGGGQTELQSAWVCLAAWCQARYCVRFLAQGSRNVCSVPICEAKSLMGYPLPSFRKAPIQSKQNKQSNFCQLHFVMQLWELEIIKSDTRTERQKDRQM